MVFLLFLAGGLSLLWFIIGLKMNKTDPNNEIEKIYPSYWHLIIAILQIGCAIFQLYMVYGDWLVPYKTFNSDEDILVKFR